MNWTIIILVGVPALALVGYLTWQNLRDEKKFEHQVENDYHKPKHDDSDVGTDQKMK